MHVNAPELLVRHFRETFEGDVGEAWITDGKKDSGVLGYIDTLTEQQALAEPVKGAQSVAGHVAHLWYSLDLFHKRIQGQNPPGEWATSFGLNGRDWTTLKADLRRAYDAVLAELKKNEKTPLAQWQELHVAGLSATTAHNAYHLGAIRQIGRVVTGK